MIDDRLKMLTSTIEKLYSRGAQHNIKKILGKTHNADIAAVLEGLKEEVALNIFAMVLKTENRAQILSYLSNDFQKVILDSLEAQERMKLLTKMDVDDAADLLGELSEEESKEILQSMNKEDSEEVADLMGYPEDSAGGLMSSDFLALHQGLSVGQAVQAIQDDKDESVLFYIYVKNDNEHLVGVISLKQLLLSRKNEKLKDIMIPNVVSVTLDTDQAQVAQFVERYDYLSLPVVDDANKLMGVITVDDVIDVIREEHEEDLLSMGQAGWGLDMSAMEHFVARLPWLLLSFFGGAVCFGIIYRYGTVLQSQSGMLWVLAAYIPLILAVSTVGGSQAATVAVGELRTGKFDSKGLLSFLIRELGLGILFSLLFGAIVLGVGKWLLPQMGWNFLLASALTLQMLFSIVIGSTLPVSMDKVGMDPAVASVPLFSVVVNISAIVILFGLFHAS